MKHNKKAALIMLNKKQQQIFVVIGAVAVVAISSLVTLTVTGALGGKKATSSSGYQNVTFTDAVTRCQQQTRKVYGSNIASLYVDDHSSRFDDKNYAYKIFLKMDIRSKKSTVLTSFYINCFVRAKNGSITKYEAIDTAEKTKDSPANDNTNMFGIPKNQ